MNTIPLSNNDMRFVVSRLPKDIRDLLTRHPRKLILGGGFVRAIIAGEEPADIDLFGPDAGWLRNVAKGLSSEREGSRVVRTDNAVSVVQPGRLMVQFITRWTFTEPEALIRSFDFTICQACIWRDDDSRNAPWSSICSDQFYPDLAARRLTYTHPQRNEDAGGSLLRAIKYVRRGYVIQVQSLAGCVARLCAAVRNFDAEPEERRTYVLTGLLREVDPSIAIDGFETVDEHAPVDGFDKVEASDDAD